jgi:hypothetical protein
MQDPWYTHKDSYFFHKQKVCEGATIVCFELPKIK